MGISIDMTSHKDGQRYDALKPWMVHNHPADVHAKTFTGELKPKISSQYVSAFATRNVVYDVTIND